MSDERREALAAYAHEAWSGWMKYLFSKTHTNGFEVIIPDEAVCRWMRQMTTPYADLPEKEKESDRAEADKMLEIIKASWLFGSPDLPDGDWELRILIPFGGQTVTLKVWRSADYIQARLQDEEDQPTRGFLGGANLAEVC